MTMPRPGPRPLEGDRRRQTRDSGDVETLPATWSHKALRWASAATNALLGDRRRLFTAGGLGLAAGGFLALLLWWTGVVSSSGHPRPQPLPPVPVLINSLGMRFVRVPPGRFLMGAPEWDEFAEADEQPAHDVTLTRELWLGQFEVTQAVYAQVMGDNPSHFGPTGDGAALTSNSTRDDLPVEMVSWFDANRFCERLSLLPEERKAGRSYRLPSEAEWEYACRAGTTTRFITGNSLPLDAANVRGRWQHPLPVGCYPPNAWGLFDMHGNVLEWCTDWHNGDYYEHSPAVDPPGPASSVDDLRVLRGGGWFFKAASSSFRDAISPYFKSPAHGFRVVCERNPPVKSAGGEEPPKPHD